MENKQTNKTICNSCGSSEHWEQISFKSYGVGLRQGVFETYRCTRCGQVRTKHIQVINEQPKGVI